MVFNILVAGESGSGKTLFIKNFLKKAEKNLKLNIKENYDSNPKNMGDLFSGFNVTNSEGKYILENEILVGTPTKGFDEYIVNNLSISKNNVFRIIDSPGYSGTRDSQMISTNVVEYINEKV